MAKIIFWEKPGCQGNKRQKDILQASGHLLEIRNLLTENWRASSLRPFFGDQPVRAWFNPLHPKIKRGEIDPDSVNERQALEMMLREPLLIRRPLLQVGQQRCAGFDVHFLDGWIGLDLQAVGPGDPQQCHQAGRPCD